MNKILQLVIVCYICLIVLIFDLGEANDLEGGSKSKHLLRPKRYLSFKNNTKFFFRLNFKANMVWWNQIFAQALGFRVNWDAPPDTFHPFHHLHRRTVYSHLENLLDRHGLNGYHCVRRAICEMAAATPRGVYEKILKMTFRKKSSRTDHWHNSTSVDDCLFSINLCPVSFMGISPYTDM